MGKTTLIRSFRAITKTSRLLLMTYLVAVSAGISVAKPTKSATLKHQTAWLAHDRRKDATDSLQVYVGLYAIAPDQQLSITLADGKLYILPPGETTKAELKPVDAVTFTVVDETARLVFTKDPSGKILQVTIQFGNGASATARKL